MGRSPGIRRKSLVALWAAGCGFLHSFCAASNYRSPTPPRTRQHPPNTIEVSSPSLLAWDLERPELLGWGSVMRACNDRQESQRHGGGALS